MNLKKRIESVYHVEVVVDVSARQPNLKKRIESIDGEANNFRGLTVNLKKRIESVTGEPTLLVGPPGESQKED